MIFGSSRRRSLGVASLGMVALLWGSAVHSNNAQSLQVSCLITSIDLDFSVINPMIIGRQPGDGTVAVGCTNRSNADKMVDLLILDTDAANHTLKTRATQAATVMLDFYVDPERRFLLSSSEASPHVLRQKLRLGPGASAVSRIRVYPDIRLHGSEPAGDYSKEANMQLLYEVYSLTESAQ